MTARRRAMAVIEAMAFIVVTVAIAKACQFTAVDAFGARIGFEGASLLALIPIIVVARRVERRLKARHRAI